MPSDMLQLKDYNFSFYIRDVRLNKESVLFGYVITVYKNIEIFFLYSVYYVKKAALCL